MKNSIILLICIMLCSANAGRDVRGSSTRIKGQGSNSRVSRRNLETTKKCNGAPSKGKSGAPSKGKSGAPSKGKNGAPSKGKNGAPSKGKNGAPSKGKNGAPSKGKNGAPSKGKNGAPSKGSSGAPSKGKDGGAPSKGKNGAPSKGSSGAPSKGKDGGQRRLYSSSGRQDSASKPIRISQTRSRSRIVRRNQVVTSPDVTPISAPSSLNSATKYSATASSPPTVDCPEPSPTETPAPTQPSPGGTPSPNETPAPTPGATQPLLSAETPSPTITPVSPGCKALEDGTVYPTDIGAVVTYKYEIQLKKGVTNLTAALENLEAKIGGYLGEEVLGCSSSSGRHLKETVQSVASIQSSSHNSNRRRLQTVSIDMSPLDTKDEAPDSKCSDISPEAESCDVINGDFSIYLEENNPSSSKKESAIEALTAISTGMSTGVFLDDEIIQTHYLGSDLSGIEDGNTFGGGTGGSNNGNVSGATQQIGGENKKLSAMGVSLIVLAVFGAIIVAFIAMRRNKEAKTSVNEHYQDDEATIITRQSKANLMSMRDIDDETASTSSSYSKWRKSRKAHVYGEDDSVISQTAGYHESILDELQELEQKDADRDLVNVHHCTSATCEICAGGSTAPKGTAFIASSYLDTVQETTPKSTSLGAREYQTRDTVEF